MYSIQRCYYPWEVHIPQSLYGILMFIAIWLSWDLKLKRACVRFVQQVWPPFWDSWDSLWIYLFRIPYESTFSLWPYGPNCYLCSKRGGHYITPYTVIVLHCWTKPQVRRARPVRCAGWGCSLLEVVTTSNYSNIRGRSSSFYGSLGFIFLLSFWFAATYYFGICCQFKFHLWTLGWRNIASIFWRFVS